MDNVKYYNDSLAYDFEMFMPREKRAQRPDNIVKLPSAKVRAKAKAAPRRLTVSAFAVMASFILLAGLCGNIFLRLKINEVNSKINDMKKEVDVLNSYKTSLEVDLERKISYYNIELEATQLGMTKMSKDKVNYIRVNDKNTAVTNDGETVSSKTK